MTLGRVILAPAARTPVLRALVGTGSSEVARGPLKAGGGGPLRPGWSQQHSKRGKGTPSHGLRVLETRGVSDAALAAVVASRVSAVERSDVSR